MDDAEIVKLFLERSENALTEVRGKYEKFCRYISMKILNNPEDADECVNETYLRAWNSIPPNKPDSLSAFLGKITRNLSLDLYNKKRAGKRGGGEPQAVLDELAECIPSENARDIVEDIALRDALNGFLKSLSSETRKIFMRRYWYMSTIREIAEDYNIGGIICSFFNLFVKIYAKLHKIRPYFTNPLTSKSICIKMITQS